jgi:hypothetical protein
LDDRVEIRWADRLDGLVAMKGGAKRADPVWMVTAVCSVARDAQALAVLWVVPACSRGGWGAARAPGVPDPPDAPERRQGLGKAVL